MQRASVTSFILIWSAAAVGCRHGVEHCRRRSPDGRHEIRVFRIPHGANDAIRIVLEKQGKSREIYSDTDDRWPRECQISWDKTHVTVVVCDALGPPVKLSYDLVNDRSMPGNSAGNKAVCLSPDYPNEAMGALQSSPTC
jgi:hypothetical protein